MPLPNLQGPQDLPGTTGQPGAANAAADSAEAAVPSEGLRAGQGSGRTKPEYTAARGRVDHATVRERANVSVQCTGLKSSCTCQLPTNGPGRV
jgi:hypothetical protein